MLAVIPKSRVSRREGTLSTPTLGMLSILLYRSHLKARSSSKLTSLLKTLAQPNASAAVPHTYEHGSALAETTTHGVRGRLQAEGQTISEVEGTCDRSTANPNTLQIL